MKPTEPTPTVRETIRSYLQKYFDRYNPYEGEDEQTLDAILAAIDKDVIGEDETFDDTHRISLEQLWRKQERNRFRQQQRTKLYKEAKNG